MTLGYEPGASVRAHPHQRRSWAKTKDIGNLLKAIRTENLPKQHKHIDTQAQKDFRTSNSYYHRKTNPGTSQTRYQKFKAKELY